MLAVCWHILDCISICWPLAPVLVLCFNIAQKAGLVFCCIARERSPEGSFWMQGGCRAWRVGVQLNMSRRAECCVIYQVAM